jgi:hypothetical protein
VHDQAFTYFQVGHVILFPAVFTCFFFLFRKTVVNVKLPSRSWEGGEEDCLEMEKYMNCTCVCVCVCVRKFY